MIGGLNYLTALDYMTACRLHPQETVLCVRSLVPWNYRGLLLTVLLEQGRVMLEATGTERSPSCVSEKKLKEAEEEASKKDKHKSGTPAGVQCLASLLSELQPASDGPQILSADSLYQLGRVEEAYRLLLSIGSGSPKAPVLARLALLQLHRGFLYDTNQLLKKLIQCGDTSCLRPLLAVAHKKDRSQLQKHCHFVAKRILESLREENMREAVAYLSIGIMASDEDASESLLERARCYACLGQRKTAIYDFSAILKDKPKHVPALCGRGFTFLMLNQQKECTQDLLAALLIYPDEVSKDILCLKEKARRLVCNWLHEFCLCKLSQTLSCHGLLLPEETLREESAVCKTLLETESRDPRWHLLSVDLLLAKGDLKAAHAQLVQVFGQDPRDAVAQGRLGVMEAWEQKYCIAAVRLSKLSDNHTEVLDSLLQLIPPNHRKRTAKAAAAEASRVSSSGQWDQALSLLTVSVQAMGNLKLQYLRQRAACLAQLGLHHHAVSDLDRVILRHHTPPTGEDELKIQTEDLCRRGRSLVLSSKDSPALEDFTKALVLHRDQAVGCIESGLGRSKAVECFLKGALQQYGEQRLDKAWTLVECGLAVDSENAELKRLRSRVKREVASPCNVN
uniref:Tetratricopeptide repeat domain 34 n=1 Tax=Knipowitschia caucasica TaxID=637954 RepID=A0AAV2LXI3_KNICA